MENMRKIAYAVLDEPVHTEVKIDGYGSDRKLLISVYPIDSSLDVEYRFDTEEEAIECVKQLMKHYKELNNGVYIMKDYGSGLQSVAFHEISIIRWFIDDNGELDEDDNTYSKTFITLPADSRVIIKALQDAYERKYEKIQRRYESWLRKTYCDCNLQACV